MYYTYMHSTPTGAPFYIGKGKASRAYDSIGRNSSWVETVKREEGFIVQILALWGTEKEAFEHEIFLIECFKHLGFQLTNKARGGQGSSGWKHTDDWKTKRSTETSGMFNHFYGKTHTGETKQKIRDKKIGQPGPWLNTKRSEETKRKISKSLTGKPGRKHTESTKAKISASKLGRKMPPVSNETKAKLSAAAKAQWAKLNRSVEGE